MHVLNYVTSALNEGLYCIGVFIDLKKAFDVCSHDVLLAKLQKMGILMEQCSIGLKIT